MDSEKMDFTVNEIPNEGINADALLEPAPKRIKIDYMFSLCGAPLDVEDTASIDLTGNEECSSNDYDTYLKIIEETAFTDLMKNEGSAFNDFTKNPASMDGMHIAQQKENVTSYAEDNTVIDLTENEECASNDFVNDSTDLAINQGSTLNASENDLKVNHVSLESVDFAPLKENVTSDVKDIAVIDLTSIEEGAWNDYQNDLTIIEEIACKPVMIDLTVNKETALNASDNEFTVNVVGTENVYPVPPNKEVTSYGENSTVDLTRNEECASNDVENKERALLNASDNDFTTNPVNPEGMDIASQKENVTSGTDSVIDLTENEECEPNSVENNASINEETISNFVEIVDNLSEDANQSKFEDKTSIEETLLDVLRVAHRPCETDTHHKIVDKEKISVNTLRHTTNELRIQRLSEALSQLKKKIADLEEAEVDWEDEDNSQFMIIERYKIRACKIYEKLSEISGVIGTSHLCDQKPITFKGTSFSEFNQTLEQFVNKTRTFPDLFDVLKRLQNCNQQYDYQLSEEDCLKTAKDAFLKLGETLKKRRKSDFYKMFSYYANSQVDPALDDPVLRAKLSSNKKHYKK